MEGGTAIRNAGREFLSTGGQRNLDLHFLQVSSEASFLQMPLDISLRNGEYKHHAVLVKCLNRGLNFVIFSSLVLLVLCKNEFKCIIKICEYQGAGFSFNCNKILNQEYISSVCLVRFLKHTCVILWICKKENVRVV